MEKIYRYISQGEGIFSIGKRLLPNTLVNEVLKAKKWLKKPKLPEGNYKFYLTEKGKEMYKKTLLLSHKKYLLDIQFQIFDKKKIRNIIYEDEYQIVERLN